MVCMIYSIHSSYSSSSIAKVVAPVDTETRDFVSHLFVRAHFTPSVS